MTVLQKFEEIANIDFVSGNCDVEIGTMHTADGYEVHYISADLRNLNFESDIFYYVPDFDTVMAAIDDHRYGHGEAIEVACYDIEDYFDEYYMLDYLQDNMDEDEFEEFSNTIE